MMYSSDHIMTCEELAQQDNFKTTEELQLMLAERDAEIARLKKKIALLKLKVYKAKRTVT